MNNDKICPECDAAGHTVTLDIFGICELCGQYTWEQSEDLDLPELAPMSDEEALAEKLEADANNATSALELS